MKDQIKSPEARRFGAPLGFFEHLKMFTCFSVHALRAECNQISERSAGDLAHFNSLRVECDGYLEITLGRLPHFNLRTPCGVRHRTGSRVIVMKGFQSTHSMWSATSYVICQSFSMSQRN